MINIATIVDFKIYSLFSQILFIRDFFFPDYIFAIENTGKDQMGHGSIGRSTVPMIDVGRAPDGVTRLDFNDFSIPCSGQADTGGHDHMLAGRMKMPGGSGAGLKGDIGP